MKKTQLQQGDVTFTKVDGLALTDGKKVKRAKRGYILADGEHTGHAHVIEDDIELIQLGEALIVANTKPVSVTHEEHGPITLEPGIWEIGRVREYDYFQEMERTVRD